MLARKSLRNTLRYGLLLLSCFGTYANAALHLELTQGISSAIPIAIMPFKEASNNLSGDTSFENIITNDLQNSGEFRVKTASSSTDVANPLSASGVTYWKKQGVNAVIIGQAVKKSADNYDVRFQLVNLYAKDTQAAKDSVDNAVVLSQDFLVKQDGLRKLAHHISDLVYEKLTGVRGVFSTKIAYVLVQKKSDEKPVYKLDVADADGFNSQTLLKSSQPIMSPAWSPDGSALAYVSFEGHHASIFVQNIQTGRRELISSFSGINGAPSFSPDGKKMALVLTKTGNPKIFIMNLATRELTQVTHGYAIDTEPQWSADSKYLYFTSNRAGGPQIFQYDFKDKQVSRVTFDGNYNARACVSPSGQALVMMHRETGVFGIAKLDLSSGRMIVLTESGADESPSLAPNGKMVLYGTEFAGHSVLGLVSTDGQVKLRLPSPDGSIQDPSWSPFLS